MSMWYGVGMEWRGIFVRGIIDMGKRMGVDIDVVWCVGLEWRGIFVNGMVDMGNKLGYRYYCDVV